MRWPRGPRLAVPPFHVRNFDAGSVRPRSSTPTSSSTDAAAQAAFDLTVTVPGRQLPDRFHGSRRHQRADRHRSAGGGRAAHRPRPGDGQVERCASGPGRASAGRCPRGTRRARMRAGRRRRTIVAPSAVGAQGDLQSWWNACRSTRPARARKPAWRDHPFGPGRPGHRGQASRAASCSSRRAGRVVLVVTERGDLPRASDPHDEFGTWAICPNWMGRRSPSRSARGRLPEPSLAGRAARPRTPVTARRRGQPARAPLRDAARHAAYRTAAQRHGRLQGPAQGHGRLFDADAEKVASNRMTWASWLGRDRPGRPRPAVPGAGDARRRRGTRAGSSASSASDGHRDNAGDGHAEIGWTRAGPRRPTAASTAGLGA